MKAALILMIGIQLSAAQWVRVDSNNVGVTGRLVVHGNNIIQYGSQSGFKMFRSSDEGTTWTNISSQTPSTMLDVYSFGGELFGVYLSNVYVSTNNGDSWLIRSTVSITGGGALWGITSEGSTLIAYSNRKSYFTSTNAGTSWEEKLISDPRVLQMNDFARSGNIAAAVFGSIGTLVTLDNGVTWKEKNPSSAFIAGVFAHQQHVYGFSFGAGLFRLSPGDTGWIPVNTGLPDNGLYQLPKSMISDGNTLYVGVYELLSTQTKLFSSVDGGATWSTVPSNGMPLINSNGSGQYLGVTSSHLFLLQYGTAIGLYRLGKLTAVTFEKENVPNRLHLSQNYPNPFNPSTVIRFTLEEAGITSLRVFDAVGRRAATLVEKRLPAGTYEITFDAAQLQSGMYFYQLRSGKHSQTRKMQFVK